MQDQPRLPITDLWRVYFILLDEEGEQDGEMGWCVVHAGRADDAQERALDAMAAYHGQETQWMSTKPHDEWDPETWPDELEQIVQGVWI